MNKKQSKEIRLRNKMDKMVKKKNIWRLNQLLIIQKYGVNYQAGKSLGQTGDERAIEPLFNALKNENEIIGDAASKGLMVLQDTLEGEIHEATLNFLFDALKDKKQCSYAQNLLGKIGPQAYKHFINALKDDNIEIRRFAVIALGNIRDKKAEVYLINVLKDKASSIRNNAAHALDLLDWHSEDRVEIFQYLFAKEDWDELAKLGDSAIDSLIAMLKETNMRRKASQALKKIGEPTIKPLMAFMNTESKGVQNVVIKILLSIKSPLTKNIRKEYETEKRKKEEIREKEIRKKIEIAYNYYMFTKGVKGLWDLMELGQPAKDFLIKKLNTVKNMKKMGYTESIIRKAINSIR